MTFLIGFVILSGLLSLSRSSSGPVEDFCTVGATIIRTLRREGFHRDLDYSVRIGLNGRFKDCRICIEEEIPSNFFVSEDELAELVLTNKLHAFVNSSVSIEAMQKDGRPHSVFIYSKSFSSSDESSPSFIVLNSLVLSIHLRYHEAKEGGGYEETFLRRPKFLYYCRQGPACSPTPYKRIPCSMQEDTLCDFREIQYELKEELKPILIPVGDTSYELFVHFTTLLAAFWGAYRITKACYRRES